MKLYLSSFRFGESEVPFKELQGENNNLVAYIPNAIDYIKDEALRAEIINNDMDDLMAQGLNVIKIDLKKYFGKTDQLLDELDKVAYIWVTGGNSFVLNQAYKMSGFDKILALWIAERKNIIYGGYSCATYVLGPSLVGFDIVDDPNVSPYNNICNICWDGLGLLDYAIVPHYKSGHKESKLMDKVLKFFKDNGCNYKTLSDGEVIIAEV